MTGIELMEEVAKQGLKVVGMTPSEAASSLGFTQLANGMFVKNVINSTAGKVLEFPTSTALEAITKAGSTAATSTTANLTLVETASGTTGTAGVLSIAAPVAASLLAAVGGYLVGNKMYEAYPDFFDGLTGSFMEYLADGTVNLMGLIDSKGNTYLDKRSSDAVKAYLDSFTPVGTDYVWDTSNLTLANFKPKCSTYIGFSRTVKYWLENSKVIANSFGASNLLKVIELASNDIDTREGTSTVKVIDALTSDIDGSFDSRYPTWGFRLCIKVFTLINSVSYVNRSNTDYYKLLSPRGNVSVYYYGVCPAYPANSTDGKVIATLPGSMGFSKFDMWASIVPPYVYNDGNAGTSIDPSYKGSASNLSTIEKSTLPDGISKYTPKTTSLTNLLLHTTVDGCPVELPYIPVRIPKNPTVIPFPDPEVNPSENDPDEDPDRLNPIIPPVVPYPPDIPVPPKKPVTPPEKNPDKKPCILPDPSNDTNNIPDPDQDPTLVPDSIIHPYPPPMPLPPTPPVIPDGGGESPNPIGPIIPNISSAATGLLHVYNPTSTQLNEFGSWLWTTFSGDIIDTVSKLFNNPMDAVIGLHELYATPSCQGVTSSIRAGWLNSGVSSLIVTTRYTSINCGSLVIPEYWGNYLDYSPYTKVYCYLPFIGIVELEADDVIAHGVNITYKIDSYTGACIAIITVAKDSYSSATYQFSGNCAVEIPITSGVKSAVQNALIGAATAGIMATAGAGVTLASAAVKSAAVRGGASRAINSKNEVQHSGSFGSNFGAMGIKKPYLIVKRPCQKVVPNYNKNYGYPAHKMVTISECSGYLRAREVNVISVTATEEEKKLIETMLKTGIYVS